MGGRSKGSGRTESRTERYVRLKKAYRIIRLLRILLHIFIFIARVSNVRAQLGCPALKTAAPEELLFFSHVTGVTHTSGQTRAFCFLCAPRQASTQSELKGALETRAKAGESAGRLVKESEIFSMYPPPLFPLSPSRLCGRTCCALFFPGCACK